MKRIIVNTGAISLTLISCKKSEPASQTSSPKNSALMTFTVQSSRATIDLSGKRFTKSVSQL